MTEASDQFPAGSEAANVKRLRQLLKPHFTVYSEVHLREPVRGGPDVRIDLVLVAPDELLEAGFPFDLFGVEVKRTGLAGRGRRHAFAQCLSYRNCVIVDKRLPALRGLCLPAVALYTADRSRYGERGLSLDDAALYGEVRLAGFKNVGVLVHYGAWGLRLEISAERIWSTRYGVTGVGERWARERRFANSTRRTA